MLQFEPIDLGPHGLDVALHAARMTLGFAVFAVGQRGLGHQGSQPCIVGFSGELNELFLGHAEVLTVALEPSADLCETTFNLGASHRHGVYGTMTVVAWLFFSGDSLRRRGAVGLVAALAATLVACGSDVPRESTLCGALAIEDLDPLSVQHVLPGAEVTYLSSPPTSGPHIGGPAPSGALDEQLAEMMQVTILEGGRTLVQYQPDLAAADIEELRALGSLRIVVAPNSTLDSRVVATRWRARLTCSEASPEDLIAFSTRTDLPVTEAD